MIFALESKVRSLSSSLQLIVLMALAKGRSVVRTGPLSLHTKTAIHIARTLTPVKPITQLQANPSPLNNYTICLLSLSLTLFSVSCQAIFNVRKLDGGAHLIECDGMGLQSNFCK